MGSTDVVRIIKRALKPQKIGHGGTLDPLATGVLPIALGEATKTIPYCQDAFKQYSFTITWGEQRSTDDAEGEVIATSPVLPSAKGIQDVLHQFEGDIEQVPPQFSAIKVNGARAYDLAREGEKVELKSRAVYIESIELIETKDNTAQFQCVCGKGTYIRSIARDMALELGTVGYISSLRRDSVGSMNTSSAISLAIFDEMDHSAALEATLLPLETMLDDIPALALNDQEMLRIKQGQKLTFIARPDYARLQQAGIETKATEHDNDNIALLTHRDHVIAMATIKGVEIKPLRVFNL